MHAFYLILPVMIPLLAGALIYFVPFPTQRARNILTASFVFFTSFVIFLLVWKRPEGTFTLLQLTDTIPLALHLDGLGIVFLCLIGFLWPLASVYAFEYMEHEEHLPRFFCFYTASYGATCGIALSANLITMYFFYEFLTLVTFPLVAHEGDRQAMGAARKYIFYSIGGAAVSFVGIMILFQETGCFAFTYGGILSGTSAPSLLLAYMLTFIGFGVKAAVFPLHDWLPAAGVAPTPVTALLHAVAVVKSGVFAVIRSTFYAFGPMFLTGTWAQETALALSGFTIIFGSTMALREQHLKRRLAYSTVSNLSYILFGVSLMTPAGLTAGLSHMLFHGLMKITLFFCAGTIICKTGREYVTELEGLGHKMPLTFAAFTIASLALTGVPLLPGFISKMNLLTAAVESGVSGSTLFAIIALMLSALLTAAYLLPVALRAFVVRDGVTPNYTEKDKDPGLRMLIPFAVLCFAMLLFGLHATPLMNALKALITA